MGIIELPSIEKIQWPHTLTDNTFSKKWMDYFGKEFDNLLRSSYKLYKDQINIDGSLKPGVDKLMTPDGNKEVSSFSKIILFHPHGQDRWARIFRDLIQRSPDRNVYAQLDRTYITMIQMVMVFPNFVYGWHTDATFKKVSGVCYFGDNGIGTKLKSGKNIKTVLWKHNRCLWFCGSSVSRESDINQERLDQVYIDGGDEFLDDIDPQITYHMFHNPLNKPRTIININLISGYDAMGILGLDTKTDIPYHQMYSNRNLLKEQQRQMWTIRVASTNRYTDPKS